MTSNIVSVELVVAVASTLITLLLSGNIFFVKRMVDKVERTSEAQRTSTAQVSNISDNVDGIGAHLQEIKSDIKDLRRIEIEVAVLRAQCGVCKFTEQLSVLKTGQVHQDS